MSWWSRSARQWDAPIHLSIHNQCWRIWLIAAGTGSAALRALDAIHVASALRVGGEIAGFVTYDDRQAAAARSAGLTVVSPS